MSGASAESAAAIAGTPDFAAAKWGAVSGRRFPCAPWSPILGARCPSSIPPQGVVLVLFLLPIPVSLVLALLWVAWTTRPRRPVEAVVSVEEYQRALRVLAEPVARRPRPRQRRDADLVSSRS